MPEIIQLATRQYGDGPSRFTMYIRKVTDDEDLYGVYSFNLHGSDTKATLGLTEHCFEELDFCNPTTLELLVLQPQAGYHYRPYEFTALKTSSGFLCVWSEYALGYGFTEVCLQGGNVR